MGKVIFSLPLFECSVHTWRCERWRALDICSQMEDSCDGGTCQLSAATLHTIHTHHPNTPDIVPHM